MDELSDERKSRISGSEIENISLGFFFFWFGPELYLVSFPFMEHLCMFLSDLWFR